jgi:hypothetical protein
MVQENYHPWINWVTHSYCWLDFFVGMGIKSYFERY